MFHYKIEKLEVTVTPDGKMTAGGIVETSLDIHDLVLFASRLGVQMGTLFQPQQPKGTHEGNGHMAESRLTESVI